MSDCWTVRWRKCEGKWLYGFFSPEQSVMCETKRCRGSLRGRMTACQRASGKLLKKWNWNWKPSKVLDVSVRDGRELQRVGPGLSGVDGLCDLAVIVW